MYRIHSRLSNIKGLFERHISTLELASIRLIIQYGEVDDVTGQHALSDYMQLAIFIPVTLFVFATATPLISIQNAYADECGDDKDWPLPDKPCPLYGAASDAELRERWDKYYQLKGKDWMEAKKAEMGPGYQKRHICPMDQVRP